MAALIRIKEANIGLIGHGVLYLIQAIHTPMCLSETGAHCRANCQFGASDLVAFVSPLADASVSSKAARAVRFLHRA